MKPVTDPNILAQLNKPVSDPALLAQLNAPAEAPAAPAVAPAEGLDPTAQAYALSKEGGPGYVEQFAGGAKHALDRAAMGVKSLLPESVQRAGDWVDEKIQGKKVLTPELLEQGKQFVSQTGPASSIGEFAGEAAITAPLGGVVGKVGTLLPKAVGKVAGGLTGAIGRGAAEGALSNVVMGPQDQSIAERATGGALTGGAVGGALPLAVKVVPKQVGNLFKGAEARGTGMLEKAVGGEKQLQDIAEQVRKAPKGSLPQTTAARAGSTQLGALERGARGRGTADFIAHDKAVDKAAWEQLRRATEVPGGVEGLRGQPGAIYAEGQAILDRLPLSQSNRAAISEEVAKLRNTNEVIANPALNREIDQILAAVDNPNATLGVLPQLYTSIDATAAGSPAIREAKRIIRNVADERSQGQFSNVLQGYGATKDALRAAETAQGLRGVYSGDVGVGEIPRMKSKPLQRGLEKGMADLEPETAAKVSKIAEGLRGREIYKADRSPGATDLKAPVEQGVPTVLKLALPWRTLKTVKELVHGLDEPAKRKADEALLDPQKFLSIMDAKRARKAALEPWEKALDEGLRVVNRAVVVDEE